MQSKLLLEDGSIFEGISIGVNKEKIGEVVLNTAVVGYQEIMSDSANAGKILVFTYPLIGNYGIAPKFLESDKCLVSGIIIKELSKMYSNWQAKDSFNNFLKEKKITALSEVDTRTLAIKIREKGQMFGIISSVKSDNANLLKKLMNYKKNKKNNFIKDISTKEITKLNNKSSGKNILILDLGVMNNFIKQLTTLGCNITLLPYNTSSEVILFLKPDALIISNGPEGDESNSQIVSEVQKLIGKVPMMGISAGHEILCLALGGKLKKMKVGHHGVNYPVKSPSSYKGEITVQNHSYVMDDEKSNLCPTLFKSHKNDVKITLRNVNDNTIEEFESNSLKIISTQYYPVSPGFDEVNEIFKRFIGKAGN